MLRLHGAIVDPEPPVAVTDCDVGIWRRCLAGTDVQQRWEQLQLLGTALGREDAAVGSIRRRHVDVRREIDQDLQQGAGDDRDLGRLRWKFTKDNVELLHIRIETEQLAYPTNGAGARLAHFADVEHYRVGL